MVGGEHVFVEAYAVDKDLQIEALHGVSSVLNRGRLGRLRLESFIIGFVKLIIAPCRLSKEC